jgi:ankyrin repeat protein
MGTALTAAVFKGYTDITEILLKNKADANLPDEQGNTPLMIACQFKNETLVKLLLQYGALKDLKNKSGQTAFEMAVLSENQSIVNLLKQ